MIICTAYILLIIKVMLLVRRLLNYKYFVCNKWQFIKDYMTVIWFSTSQLEDTKNITCLHPFYVNVVSRQFALQRNYRTIRDFLVFQFPKNSHRRLCWGKKRVERSQPPLKFTVTPTSNMYGLMWWQFYPNVILCISFWAQRDDGCWVTRHRGDYSIRWG